jgi:hypothetical protein
MWSLTSLRRLSDGSTMVQSVLMNRQRTKNMCYDEIGLYAHDVDTI